MVVENPLFGQRRPFPVDLHSIRQDFAAAYGARYFYIVRAVPALYRLFA
jgi:hypothetical protein